MKSIFQFYPELKNIIPYDKEFNTKNFKKTFFKTRTLSYSNKDNIDDFDEFKSKIFKNLGNKFLPILRMSDGELLLLSGIQNESRRANLLVRISVFFKNILKKYLNNDYLIISSHIYGDFDHSTGHSEIYKFEHNKLDQNRILEIREKFLNEIGTISQNGILAIHYSYSYNYSLVEKFWLNFNLILKKNSIILNENNCFPFYFVYMLLSEKDSFQKLIKKNKILCISSAIGDKKHQISNTIKSYEPEFIDWLNIPSSKTFFHKIDVDNYKHTKYDLILLAAGAGKSNIINQLSIFNCPVIDCGYYFEIWNNKKLKYKRVGCVTDDEY